MSGGRRSAGALLSIVLGALLLAGACTNQPLSQYGYPCTGPTSFQVFQPDDDVSAIPFCTDATDAGINPAPYGSTTTAPYHLGDAAAYAFPGAPDQSAAALAQCAAICVGTTYSFPCCRSQWIPQTIACYPACP